MQLWKGDWIDSLSLILYDLVRSVVGAKLLRRSVLRDSAAMVCAANLTNYALPVGWLRVNMCVNLAVCSPRYVAGLVG